MSAVRAARPGERAPPRLLRGPPGLRLSDAPHLEETPHEVRRMQTVPRGPGCCVITASPPRIACSAPGPPSGRRVQVGYGRTVKEVATELGCDWHTVNDTVITYGEALLSADRQRVVHTSALGLDETNFVRARATSTPATPRRSVTSSTTASSTSCPRDVSRWWPVFSMPSPPTGRRGSASGPSICPTPTPRSTRSSCPRPRRWLTPSTSSSSPT